METLQIEKANAVKAYNSATKLQKQLLENMFGIETFKQKKTGPIIERVKTFEDACNEAGIDLAGFNLSCQGLPADEMAYRKLKIIRNVLNEGWKPNWDDSNECKYWPYFDMRSGSGFSSSAYDYRASAASAGSRLCFKSRDLAIYAGNQFTDIYKDYMTE